MTLTKTESEVKVQELFDAADRLQEQSDHELAIKKYLEAIREAQMGHDQGLHNPDWIKKVMCMGSNSLAISYSKIGKQDEALEEFIDAVIFAPTDKDRERVRANLDKLVKRLQEVDNVDRSQLIEQKIHRGQMSKELGFNI